MKLAHLFAITILPTALSFTACTNNCTQTKIKCRSLFRINDLTRNGCMGSIVALEAGASIYVGGHFYTFTSLPQIIGVQASTRIIY